jgi:hypothetical protein
MFTTQQPYHHDKAQPLNRQANRSLYYSFQEFLVYLSNIAPSIKILQILPLFQTY